MDENTPYIERLRTLLGDRDPMAVLSELDETLDGLLAGLLPEQLTVRHGPGTWSIEEVVAHLADTELVYGYRLRTVLVEDRPRFPRFDQDRWCERFAYRCWPVDAARRQLTVLRERHLELLASLDVEACRRSGTHDSRGEESVTRMRFLWAGHDVAHRQQLERLRGAALAATGSRAGRVR